MKRKRTPVLPKKTILIATSSAAVAAYFSRVRKDCRYVSMTVECFPANDLESLIKAASKARIAGKFACTWAVFDFDQFNLKAEDINQIMPFAESKKVKLAWNVPSLSMWLFLHLKELNVYVDNASSFDQALAKVFPNFAQSAEYMTNEGQDIHLRLFSSFSKAVMNASSYNKICEKKLGIAATTFPLLYQDIKLYCGEADLSHNMKLLTK